jgi:hypothetical protein
MEWDMSLTVIECQHVHELPEGGSSSPAWGTLGCFGISASALWQNIARAFCLLSRSSPFLLSSSNSHIHDLCPPLSRRAHDFSRETYAKIQELIFSAILETLLSQDGPW